MSWVSSDVGGARPTRNYYVNSWERGLGTWPSKGFRHATHLMSGPFAGS